MKTIEPRDHAEAVALFRAEVVGALTRRTLMRGQLRQELQLLSQQHLRPPQAKTSRTFSVPTLERWYYAYRRGGLDALRPEHRKDRGRGRALDEATRDLLIDIRREHPNASVPLILRTLIADGRLDEGTVSAGTVRRLYRERGLPRVSKRRAGKPAKVRLRWQAEMPNALWHADVCYGKSVRIQSLTKPIRIHGILDDASRYVVALEARHTEQEVDMVDILCRSIQRHGVPDVLYLDNGSTYRGDILRVACERLGVTLIHAKPYDAEARGKMERFWRTLREAVLDFIDDSSVTSLHDLNVRLLAFLEQHYHQAPHAALIGRSPQDVYAERSRVSIPDEATLRTAFTTRVRRRIRKDSTLDLRGQTFEVQQGFLARRTVTVGFCALDEPLVPWVEYQDKRFELRPVDVIANSRRRRPEIRTEPTKPVNFDPNQTRVDKLTGRRPNAGDDA